MRKRRPSLKVIGKALSAAALGRFSGVHVRDTGRCPRIGCKLDGTLQVR